MDNQGKQCHIDTGDPWVILRTEYHGENYIKGSIVYPIASHEGDKQKDNYAGGYIALSTLDTDTADFCAFEKGVSAIPLSELIQQTR